jgi:hypothetical protein
MMTESKVKLNILINFGPGIGDIEVKKTCLQLCDEFQILGVNSVEVDSGSPFPPGVKPKNDPITVGTIIVTLATAGVFTALVETLRAWALRKEARQVKIKVQVGEKIIEFEYSPTAVSEKELLGFTESIMKVIDNEKHMLISKKKKV